MPINFTEAEVTKLLGEVMDPNKVLLTCKRHMYVGCEKPPEPKGCKNCWEAYWWFMIASTPPHLRQERLEQAYRAVYDAVKMAERGEFDFEPLARPVITTEKDAYENGVYKPTLKGN